MYIAVKIFLSLLFFAVSLFAQASLPGRPFISNFGPSDYNGGAQNWCAVQDKRGIIYFGNNNGIMEYDGSKWRMIDILDNRTAFTLNIDSFGKIWAGTLNDFGYLENDSLGNLYYESLGYLIPDSLKPVGKVRSIKSIGQASYVLTPDFLLEIDVEKSQVWRPRNKFYRQFVIDDKLYLYDINNGLMTLSNDSLISASNGEYFKSDPILALFKYGDDKLFISTWKNGLYKEIDGKIKKFNTSIEKEIKTNPIIDAHPYGNDKFILAGFTGGSYVIDQTGKLLWNFNKSTGLENELCNRIFIDNSDALWLCNNYGISRAEINTPFTLFEENEGIKENVVFIKRIKDALYAATDDKLYYSPYLDSTISFKAIDRIDLVYSMIEVEDEILAASHYGVYQLKNHARKNLIVLDNKSCYSVAQSAFNPNVVFVGTEKGLSLLNNENGKWEYDKDIKGVNAEIRYILEDPSGDVWLGTAGQGVIRYSIKDGIPDVEYYGLHDGLYDLKNYKITLINNEPIFYAQNSPALKFNKNENMFYPDSVIFNKNENVSILAEDENRNIWLKKRTEDGWRISFGKINEELKYNFKEKIFNRIAHANPGFIYPDSNGVTWFGSPSLLIRYDPNIAYDLPGLYKTNIRKVQFNKSTVFAGFSSPAIRQNILELPHKNNSVRFEFALPTYESRKAVRFQYYLEGFEETWSAWTDETQKDYTNLFEGEYIFHVRGRDIFDNTGEEDTYSFKIMPPWYRTIYAYSAYLLLFIGTVFAFDRFRTSQITKKNRIELERKLNQEREIENAKSEERQRVRKKTAADFHDDLGHLLTKITLYSEIAKKNSEDKMKLSNYLSNISKNSAELSSGVKDLIWTLDTDKDSLYDVLIRIKDFGDSLFDPTDITFSSCGFSEDLKKNKLSMEIRRHILLIFKEAMNNCLKYSQCDRTELFTECIDENIIITFTDNGIGFDPLDNGSGNGLKNMKMRADNLEADFEIASKSGKTSIKLKLKLNGKNSSNG